MVTGGHDRLAQIQASLAELGSSYEVTDIGPFAPSGAIYFMNGSSGATVQFASGDELALEFQDENTSIAASAPILYQEQLQLEGLYVPVPPPLRPSAFLPWQTPDEYRRDTALQLLQVVSMNMRGKDMEASLLIGLPYAERYPEIFFRRDLFEGGGEDASSYGVVQSLTRIEDPASGHPTTSLNGYPVRSFFGIFHIVETLAGAFFNKKPTQMELQPDAEGKLALTLPPIPFEYALLNGPIPLRCP